MMILEKIAAWKNYTIVISALGFFTSIIAGIIGRVTFFTILIRGFLFAVLLGCLSLVVMFLIEKFIPELLGDVNEHSKKNEEEKSSKEKGQKIDVTIEDDDAPYENDKEKNILDTENIHQESMEESMEASMPEYMDELEVSDSTDDDIEEIETIDIYGTDDEEKPEIDLGDRKTKKAENKETALDMIKREKISGNSFQSSEDIETLGEAHTAEELAKAVHTVLKKDQEG